MIHAEQPSPPLRIALHSIRSLSDLPEELRRSYSEMKYGSDQATRAWAKAIAEKLLAHPELQAIMRKNCRKYIASSAHGSVPTAAHELMLHILGNLNAGGWTYRPFDIGREGGFERTDYGQLSWADREEAILHRRIFLVAGEVSQLHGNVLLIVDDLRCTGAHERAIEALVRSNVEDAQIVFVYGVAFEGDLPAGSEEELNHESIRGLGDLLAMIQREKAPLVMNARLLKHVLLQSSEGIEAYIETAGEAASRELYEAAISEDRYHDKPRLRGGFHVLEEGLMRRGWIGMRASIRLHNAYEGRIVRWNIREAAPGRYVDTMTDEPLDAEVALYSRFKHGDVEAIRHFGRELANEVIYRTDVGSFLRPMLNEAKEHGQFVSITAPGVRNVVSASNFLMREAAQRLNLYLSLQGWPTMAIRTLGRLRSGRDNYAELSSDGRAERDLRTQTLIPRSEYEAYPSHVVFLDDVEVTGQTVNRARAESLAAGALSFRAIYLFRVEPEQAAADPGIEHRMNQATVTGGLEAVVAEILRHPDYQPVQRMLRLLLHPRNRENLQEFLAREVGDAILTRLYLGAMGNDYLWINGSDAYPPELGMYGASVEIMRWEMLRRGLVDGEGLLL